MRDRLVATLALTALLGGCATNPNAMVFGTNTVLGISAGTGAANTPGVTVGYKRQEAVVMPLVANVSLNGEVLTACSISDTEVDGKHPCVLNGSQEDGAGKSKTDSLSVLASFGTEYRAVAQNPEAKGQITQYFATGIAARNLADRAGASAVATGETAAASVDSNRTIRKNLKDQISQNIEKSSTYPGYLTKLDKEAGLNSAVGDPTFSDLCKNKSQSDCALIVRLALEDDFNFVDMVKLSAVK